MKTGRLRHHITIQKSERGQTPSGSVITQWVDVATVSAEVRPVSGRELIASGMQVSEQTIRIWLRYRSDITTSHRIVYDGLNAAGNKLNIVAVIPDVRHTRLELLCKEGVMSD